MSNEELITREGYDQLKADIERLESEERIRIADEIAKARAYGDLSENFEYQSAKEEQAQLEARISQLKKRLKNASIVEAGEMNTGKINVGHKVTLKDVDNNKEMVFHLVGQGEANAAEGKISIQSPIGQGLFGRKVGDSVKIDAPAKTLTFKVLKIN